jgi:hypothetical protein
MKIEERRIVFMSRYKVFVIAIFAILFILYLPDTFCRTRWERVLKVEGFFYYDMYWKTMEWRMGLKGYLNGYMGMKSGWFNSLEGEYSENKTGGAVAYPRNRAIYITRYEYYISRFFYPYLRLGIETPIMPRVDPASNVEYRYLYDSWRIGATNILSRYVTVTYGLEYEDYKHFPREGKGFSAGASWVFSGITFYRPFGKYRGRLGVYENLELRLNFVPEALVFSITSLEYKFTDKLSLSSRLEYTYDTRRAPNERSLGRLDISLVYTYVGKTF